MMKAETIKKCLRVFFFSALGFMEPLALADETSPFLFSEVLSMESWEEKHARGVQNFLFPFKSNLKYHSVPHEFYDYLYAEDYSSLDLDLIAYEFRTLETFDLSNHLLFAQNEVSQSIADLMISSLNAGQYYFVENLIRFHGRSMLWSEDLVSWIIYQSIEWNQPNLVAALESTLEDRFWQDHPFLGLLVSITYLPNHQLDENHLAVFSNFKPFNSSEKVILSGIFYAKGYLYLARTALEELGSLTEIDPDLAYCAAQLCEQLNLVNEGLVLIDEARDKQPDSPMLDKAWLLLAAASGKTREVMTALELEEHVPEEWLRTLFTAAADYRHDVLALKLVQWLNRDYGNVQNQHYLAQAYLLNLNPILTINLIEKMGDKKSLAGDLHLQALTKASDKYLTYRPKLREEIFHHLSHYPTSPKEQRELAYRLLEYGYREEASILLMDLAYSLPSSHADVQTLLTLWGDPSSSSFQWVFNKAKRAQDSEREFWLNYLQEYHQYAMLAALFSWEDLSHPYIADLYIKTLQHLEDYAELSQVVSYLGEREESLERLKKIGELAKCLDCNETVERIYYRAYQKSPHDKEVLKELGYVSAALGKYGNAEYLANLYYALEPSGEPHFNYHYARVLEKNNKLKRAEALYKSLLQQLMADSNKDTQLRLLQARLHRRFKQAPKAIEIYSQLIKEQPDNLKIRAEFAWVLMDLQYYQDANQILSTTIEKDTKQLHQFKSIKEFEKAREKLIAELNKT